MLIFLLGCASTPEVAPPASGRQLLEQAQAELAVNDFAKAETLVRDAVLTLDHEAVEFPDAVLMLGEIQTRAGKVVDLPPVQVDEARLREAISLRIAMGDADAVLPVVTVLTARDPSEGLHGARAGLAWQVGDVKSARDSVSWLRSHGSPQGRFEAGLLGARLEEEAGDAVTAEAIYADTCAHAPESLKARCQRELGLFLAQLPERTAAARTALRAASVSADPDVAGRALAALGVLEAHEGTESLARTVLTEALTLLSPIHPEAIVVRNHLEALGTSHCGCETPQGGLEADLEAAADAALPGLVQSVTLAADGSVQMALSREATEAEQAQLAEIQEGVLRTLSPAP